MESQKKNKGKGSGSSFKSWFSSKVDKIKSKLNEGKESKERELQRANLEIYDLDSESRACNNF
jgi:hypothetical protein